MIKILKEYKGKYGRKRVICENEFGKLDLDFVNYKQGHLPGIGSAINKKLYFQHQLDKLFGKGKIIILNEYINTNIKILISVDKIQYITFPKNLLKGILPNIRSAVNKTKCFIKESKKIHNNIYDYSLVNYKSNHENVDIICKIHGKFSQECKSHLKGSGCPLCGTSKAFFNRTTFTKGIENGIVYCLKMKENNGDIFYKIGFTRHSVIYRYSEHKTKKSFKIEKENKVRMPYQYEIIFESVYPYKDAIKKEKELHKYFGLFHYKPDIKFDGSATECYTKIDNYEKLI